MKPYQSAFKLCVLALALACYGSARVLDTVQWAALEDVSSSETISTFSTLTTSFLTCPTPAPQDDRAIYLLSSCDFDRDANSCAIRKPSDDFDDPYLDDPDNPEDGGPEEAPIGVSDASSRSMKVPSSSESLPGTNGRVILLRSRPYPGSTTVCEALEGAGIVQDCEAFRLRSQICQETTIETFDHSNLLYSEKKQKYATEHNVELNYVKRLLVTAINGTLSSGGPLRTATIPFDSFFDCFNQKDCVPPYSPPGSTKDFTKPADILFEILGSDTNLAGFFLVERGLNQRKAKCLALHSPVDAVKFRADVDDSIASGTGENVFLQPIRETIGAWQYMSDVNVASSISDKRTFLLNGISYISRNAKDRNLGRLEDIFREMDQDLWDTAADRCKTVIADRIQSTRNNFTAFIASTGYAPANWDRVEKALDIFEDHLSLFVAPQAPYPPR